jgi:tetratricopeptide (TPR) repeat protein
MAVILGLSAAAPFAAHAAASAELLDLAGRIHYGYYHAEPRTIDAALTGLDRLGDAPDVVYYRDFAALRRAQLGSTDRAGTERLRACAQRDVPPLQDKRLAAEAWVLIAACAQVAGDDGRRDRALALARERDDDNPRVALVEAWAMMRSAGTDVAKRAAAAAKLEAVVEAFEMWTPSLDDPDWGYAEALTGVATAALERGQARTARDFIERALLLAPDYRAALDLRVAMQSTRGTERPL